MSNQTYSRSFLKETTVQVMIERLKQQYIDELVQGFIMRLQNEAAAGKTFYIHDPNGNRPVGLVITTNEYVSAFQRKFPDCDVSYKEQWVDVNSTTRVLKKGIIIDWS